MKFIIKDLYFYYIILVLLPVVCFLDHLAELIVYSVKNCLCVSVC